MTAVFSARPGQKFYWDSRRGIQGFRVFEFNTSNTDGSSHETSGIIRIKNMTALRYFASKEFQSLCNPCDCRPDEPQVTFGYDKFHGLTFYDYYRNTRLVQYVRLSNGNVVLEFENKSNFIPIEVPRYVYLEIDGDYANHVYSYQKKSCFRRKQFRFGYLNSF